ncbi:hypothetical protein M427DRAFT_32405 [Gonapodya prolifera JEL478]|uniref:Pyrrolo-quinoline quinone repeat domain-containing protein n=1 Tax=Gonapodya prolifera (strain JEL478) TaxID=1344416 RepID=A0A139AFI9_GONPJ|nr:hypothetical protein M427DRAFT_32405 [Gonapodya prolifera JEL478]|eukprot:KXS15459.1 hypothetical protein M427DRAFT_32405 [Gonapodya prolifera JEL478]
MVSDLPSYSASEALTTLGDSKQLSQDEKRLSMAREMIFVGTIGHVHAIDKRTGTTVWKNSLPSAGMAIVTLTLDRSRCILFVGIVAKVIAIDAATGAELWRTPFPQFVNIEPVTLLLPSASTASISSSVMVSSTPAVEPSITAIRDADFSTPPPNDLLLAVSKCRAMGISIDTGAVVWQQELVDAGREPTAILSEGNVVYFGAGGNIYAHNSTTGRPFWKATVAGSTRGSYMTLVSLSGVNGTYNSDPSVQNSVC